MISENEIITEFDDDLRTPAPQPLRIYCEEDDPNPQPKKRKISKKVAYIAIGTLAAVGVFATFLYLQKKNRG